MTTVISAIGRWLPRGWGDLFRQIGLLVLADLLYETARGIADGDRLIALSHGQHVIAFERSLGLFFEPGFQAFFIKAEWLVDVANQIYLNAQFSVALGFLVWLYLFRNDAYYFVRNMFMVSMVLALIGYIGYPTAPPRMFPQDGFVDTINAHSSINHDSALAKIFINPYAAVPSMHCAFALMIGGTCVRVCKSTVAKCLWALWPPTVIFVVIVTANHYWFDAVLGVLVAICSALIASQVLAKIRPEKWGWRARDKSASAESTA